MKNHIIKELTIVNLLKKIDCIHEIEKSSFEASSDNFCCFIPIHSCECDFSCNFLIKKKEKAKLLIVSGKQRVYLSDSQIIKTICAMKQDIVKWFVGEFYQIYKGKYAESTISIGSDQFKINGMNFYDKNVEIQLFSDTIITINDLVFVLNFIFTKDYLWEKMMSIKDYRKNTICKYIVLINYYVNNSEYSKSLLSEVNFDFDNPESSKSKKALNKIGELDISKFV